MLADYLPSDPRPAPVTARFDKFLAWLQGVGGLLVIMLGVWLYALNGKDADEAAVLGLIGFAACVNALLLLARGRIGLWMSFVWPPFFMVPLTFIAIDAIRESSRLDVSDFVFYALCLTVSSSSAWYFYRKRSQFKGLLYTDPSNRGEH